MWRASFSTRICVCVGEDVYGVRILISYTSTKLMRWKSLEQSHLLNYLNWPRAQCTRTRPATSWATKRTRLNCIQSHCFEQWVNNNSNDVCVCVCGPLPVLVSVVVKNFQSYMCVSFVCENTYKLYKLKSSRSWCTRAHNSIRKRCRTDRSQSFYWLLHSDRNFWVNCVCSAVHRWKLFTNFDSVNRSMQNICSLHFSSSYANACDIFIFH